MSGGQYGRGKAPERVCMKVEHWPARDRELWQASLSFGELFDDAGSRSERRTLSNLTVGKGYGRWLTFLDETGQLDPSEPPAARITSKLVEGYLARLKALGNASLTILNRVHELHSAALVMGPSHDWSFLKRLLRRLRARRTPHKDKRQRMVSAEELLGLGLSLMEGASSAGTPRQLALANRDGLIIALFALQPLRRCNLGGLVLGRTLVERNSVWTITIPGEETKTGQAIEVPWPADLAAHLHDYLTNYRPILMRYTGRAIAPIGRALWVSAHGSPLSNDQIYGLVMKRTKAAFGKGINPHLARDIAATTLAIADPVHVRAAGPLLGHASFSTTEKHYQQAQGIDAQRRYYEMMARLRMGEDSLTLDDVVESEDA